MPHQFFSKGRATAPSDLFIATTSGSGQPMPNYSASLADTYLIAGQRGLAFDYLFHTNDCHVDDARNACVKYYLEHSQAPRMLFVDDDVGWDAEEFMKFLEHDVDVVCAAYPKKGDDLDFPVMTPPRVKLMPDATGKLIRLRGAPTGFLLMKRSVVEKMAKSSTEYFQQHTDESPTALMFERAIVNGKRWSGDFFWSKKWLIEGGDIWVDPEMSMSHCGLKIWQGHLGDHWRRRNNIVDGYFDAAMKMLLLGTRVDHNVFTVLYAKSGNPIPEWQAPPEMLEVCYREAQKAEGPILEAGSGLTTLCMAAATDQTIYTLEHDVLWFKRMVEYIKAYRLRNIAIAYAPLRFQADGTAWYERPPEFPDAYDLVVCDGPPRQLADRRKLWHVFSRETATAKTWIVDDVDTEPKSIKFLEQHGDVELIDRFAVVRRTAENAATKRLDQGEANG